MNCAKLTSTLCFGAALLLAACGGDPKDDASGGESSSGSTSSSTDTPTGDEVTSTPMTTSTSGMSAEGTETTDASTSTSTGPDTGVTTGAPACGDPENQDNDATCTDKSGCGCKSGKCFLVPILGGWCGECLVDTDCGEGGCSVPNPIAGVGATCNMGEPGSGCMSDDVCTDPLNLQCGTLLDVPGIISVATCGECAGNEGNADCADPALPNCTPTYDVMNFSGKYVCVGDNTVPQDGGCNLLDPEKDGTPLGNTACMSGFCGEANVMGLLKLGICGECNSNDDCPQGQTCTDPQVDLNAAVLVGSVCQ